MHQPDLRKKRRTRLQHTLPKSLGPQPALRKRAGQGSALSQRARGNGRNEHGPYVPPEDWHHPQGINGTRFEVVVQAAGKGYRHAVTEQEVRERLAQLPDYMLEPLEVVQLSRITRKKRSFPCYGMQWGNALYLYPIESSLTEFFGQAPTPAQWNEARMYGGRWVEMPPHSWELIWTPETLRDFYLNNILIHELGHLLDNRNTRYDDRERYAEWFAIEHGYRTTRQTREPSQQRPVRRRHHSS